MSYREDTAFNSVDKDGELVCGVCNHYWSSHTIGGNCVHAPQLSTHEDEDGTLRFVYEKEG